MKVAALLTSLFIGLPIQVAGHDTIRQREWIVPALRLAEIHKISTGHRTVIALLDTGVDANHVDLSGRVQAQFDLTTTGDQDAAGHGTFMAGLLAGTGHGSKHDQGILGIAPQAKLISIKTACTEGSETTLLDRGIDLAIARHVGVICIAASGPIGAVTVRQAILRAEQADIVVVAAAGNRPGSKSVEYPAAYPGVIAAGGTDQNGNHAEVSVTGPQIVLSAPAVDIVSTLNDGGYGIGTGTSNSAAIIAGAAALVRSKFPNLSAAEVVHRLTATAIDKGPPGRDDEYGYGIVNLVGALTADVPPLAPDASPTAQRPSEPNDWSPLVFVGIGTLLAVTLWLAVRRRA